MGVGARSGPSFYCPRERKFAQLVGLNSTLSGRDKGKQSSVGEAESKPASHQNVCKFVLWSPFTRTHFHWKGGRAKERPLALLVLFFSSPAPFSSICFVFSFARGREQCKADKEAGAPSL